VPACCRLAVKVIPGASRDSIEGWVGDELKVKVRAPALDGRANAAVCEFLATSLMIPRRSVSLIRGDKSRHKVIQVESLTREEIRQQLPCGS
jgi:uncharacterized protein